MIWGLVGGLAALPVGAGPNLAACPGLSVTPLFPPQCGLSLHLDIDPPRPAPGDDIAVIAAGEWRDSCVPTYLIPRLLGQVVRVEAVLDYPLNTGCLCVITPWQLSADLGRLPGGVYRVELYTTDLREPGTLYHCASKWFAVGAELHLVYLPTILGSAEVQADSGPPLSAHSAVDPVVCRSELHSTELAVHSGK